MAFPVEGVSRQQEQALESVVGMGQICLLSLSLPLLPPPLQQVLISTKGMKFQRPTEINFTELKQSSLPLIMIL